MGMTAEGWMALATFLAALVPLVLFLIERRDRKAAEGNLARERGERAAQERIGRARSIAPTVFAGGGSGLDDDPVDVTPQVANYGSLPVFDAWFYYEHNKTPSLIGTWATIGPGEMMRASEQRIEWDPDDVLETGCIHIPRSWVEFTDTAGERWRRYADGRVEECDPHPWPGVPEASSAR